MENRDIYAEFDNDFNKAKEPVYVANIIAFTTWAYFDTLCKQCDKKQGCDKCPVKFVKDVWDVTKKSFDEWVKKSGEQMDPNSEDYPALKFQALLTCWYMKDQCDACEVTRGDKKCKDCLTGDLYEYWRDVVKSEKIGNSARAATKKRPAVKKSSKKKSAKKK